MTAADTVGVFAGALGTFAGALGTVGCGIAGGAACAGVACAGAAAVDETACATACWGETAACAAVLAADGTVADVAWDATAVKEVPSARAVTASGPDSARTPTNTAAPVRRSRLNPRRRTFVPVCTPLTALYPLIQTLPNAFHFRLNLISRRRAYPNAKSQQNALSLWLASQLGETLSVGQGNTTSYRGRLGVARAETLQSCSRWRMLLVFGHGRVLTKQCCIWIRHSCWPSRRHNGWRLASTG